MTPFRGCDQAPERAPSLQESTAPLRIGHPSGMLPIVADVAQKDGAWTVNEVLFSRTARRIMEGWAYVRKSRLADSVYCESHEAQGRTVVEPTA